MSSRAGLFVAGVVALAAPVGAAVQGAAYPLQVEGLELVHRSGQTFVTWDEVPGMRDGSYRVYRSACPITDVSGLTPIREVWADSGEFYADRRKLDVFFLPRYVDRLYVPVDAASPYGRRVEDGEGLLAWTLRPADLQVADPACDDGVFHYAVTAVSAAGLENTAELGPANVAAVVEGVDDPLPVEIPQADLIEDPADPAVHVLIQYMDPRAWNTTFHAPNPTNCWWGEDPAEPAIRHAEQYAYAYAVVAPTPDDDCGCPPCGAGPHPVVMRLHPRGGNRWAAQKTYRRAGNCAYRINPVDVTDTWWFGFADGFDYRDPSCPSCFTSGAPCPVPPRAPGVAVVNFTEARLLRMVHDLLRDPRFAADPERVYVEGHSMGGSGALSLALRYPNVFAAARASKPMTSFRSYLNNPGFPSYADDLMALWGDPAVGSLPVLFQAPAGWADPLTPHLLTPVWNWQDHPRQLARREGEDMAPFAIVHGFNDPVIPFGSQVAHAYPVLQDARRTWGGNLTCSGHDLELATALPPGLEGTAAGCGTCPAPPYAGYRVRRSESTPGLSQHFPVQPDPTAGSCATGQGALYQHDLQWSSSWNPWDVHNGNAATPGAPVDRPDTWAVGLRVVGANHAVVVDVTPRRLQRFRVDPGVGYRWSNVDVVSGAEIQGHGQGGVVYPDDDGLLRVPAFLVTPSGNRLILDRLEPGVWER